MLRAGTIDAKTAELLSASMQNLVTVLGQASDLTDDDDGEDDAVH